MLSEFSGRDAEEFAEGTVELGRRGKAQTLRDRIDRGVGADQKLGADPATEAVAVGDGRKPVGGNEFSAKLALAQVEKCRQLLRALVFGVVERDVLRKGACNARPMRKHRVGGLAFFRGEIEQKGA